MSYYSHMIQIQNNMLMNGVDDRESYIYEYTIRTSNHNHLPFCTYETKAFL
jgi:hypothetical protein